MSEIRGELPGLSFSKVESETQICPICEVPIDRAIAESCKLSHKLQDPEASRARWERRKREFEDQEQKLDAFRQQRTGILQQLSLAKQKWGQLRDRAAAIENARDSREATWYSARSVQDDVERLMDLFGVQEAAMRKLSDITTKLESERGRLSALRDKQAQVFGRLSEKFDPIVRRFLGQDARGRIALSGNGIDLSIDLGGERATATIDSLKVLAFDLAAMCLSIEGKTRVPAFLLHDSPREADLGLSIYHELFRCVRDLEKLTEEPMFQYIVTTTTEPPDAFKADPSLCLVIRGGPAEERLLRTDL